MTGLRTISMLNTKRPSLLVVLLVRCVGLMLIAGIGAHQIFNLYHRGELHIPVLVGATVIPYLLMGGSIVFAGCRDVLGHLRARRAQEAARMAQEIAALAQAGESIWPPPPKAPASP